MGRGWGRYFLDGLPQVRAAVLHMSSGTDRSIEFMRPFSQQVYGIVSEQVLGTISQVRWDTSGSKPLLIREPKIDSVDDGPGKAVNIYRVIGRRPIAAFGNSDGDLQMFQPTAAGSGRRLMLLVHHDDARREFAYDRQSHIAKTRQSS